MDASSRKKTTVTTMKRRLLTILLTFAIVATYIPFDRAFAANESGKKQDEQLKQLKQVKKTTIKDTGTDETDAKYFKFDPKFGAIKLFKRYEFGAPTEVVIPAKIDGIDVSSIGREAFIGCKNLTSITVPNSVKAIGVDAFAGCSKLKRIYIDHDRIMSNLTLNESRWGAGDARIYYRGESDPTILYKFDKATGTVLGHKGSFDNSAPDVIKIPSYIDGVKVKKIGKDAFEGCKSLKSITIPNTVTHIENGAFNLCKSLKSVTISSGVTHIGRLAFSGCTALTAITIPDSVTNLWGDAFAHSKLKTIYVDQDRKTSPIASAKPWGAPRYARIYYRGETVPTDLYEFDKATGTISRYFGEADDPAPADLKIPSRIDGVEVKKIGKDSFLGCESLKSVTIPSGVTQIEAGAFLGCGSLRSISIPSGVTQIGYMAFWRCRNLSSIEIPGSVIDIGSAAFRNCHKLKTIYVDGDRKISPLAGKENGWEAEHSIIYYRGEPVPTGMYNFEKSTGTILKYFGESEDPAPTEVKIPSHIDGVKVEKIGEKAFAGCDNLMSVTIPGSVTKLQEGAFAACPKLESVTIQEGMTEIGAFAFWKCHSLKNVTIPNSVEAIGDRAFEGCGDLEKITLPKANIAWRAFLDCGSLKSVIFERGVRSITNESFAGCYALTAIGLPDTFQDIHRGSSGDGAFDGCINLEYIYIDKTEDEFNKTVTKAAGDYLIGLKKKNIQIIFKDTEKTSHYLFDKANGTILKYFETANGETPANVVVPSRIEGIVVKNIAYDAFHKCDHVTSITLPEGIERIEKQGISENKNLKELKLPTTLKYIGKEAFGGNTSLKSMVIPENVEEMSSDAFKNSIGMSFIYVDMPKSDCPFAKDKPWGAPESCKVAYRADIIPKGDVSDDWGSGEYAKDYVKVTFGSDAEGSIEGESKYFVRKDKRIDLTDIAKGKAKANPGYTFHKWDKPLEDTFDSDTVITAKYLSNDKPTAVDPGEKLPEGFVKVTFDKGEHGELTGDKVFAIRNDREYDLTDYAPKVKAADGYKFTGWSKNLEGKFTEDATITARYEEIHTEDIIVPNDPKDPKPSEAYARITFVQGEHGSLEGKTVVDVKKNVDVDLKEHAPKVKAADGYRFTGWSKEIKGKFAEDTTITAQYNKLKDVEPGTDPKPSKDYVKVTFKLGEYGKEFTGGDTSFYVKKNVDVELEAPKILPKDGYKFTGWSKAFKGRFTEDISIIALYKKLENIEPGTDPKPSEAYVKVTFNLGEHGKEFTGDDTSFYVKNNVEVDLKDNAPKVKAADGYRFSGWSKDLKGKFAEDTTITAEYKKLENIEPGTDPKPSEEYVKVTFNLGEHGKEFTGGDTSFYVKNNVEVDLKDNAPKVKAADGYKFSGWSKDLKGKFTEDTEITAQYEELKAEERIVTYKANDKIVGIEYVESGKTPANVPDAPAKEGHRLIGWQKDGTGDIYTKDALGKVKISENATYVAKYEEVSAGHKLVIFAVDGKIVDIQKVVSGKKLEKVPEEPKVEGYTFEGWKMEGTNNIYSADRVKDLEINKDTTFVASLKKNAQPAMPDGKKPEQPKPATPAKPAAPVTPNADKTGRSPLLIKSSKTITLTPQQQKDMAEGKYSYMGLTVKNISVRMSPEEFKALYSAGNTKTYFKVATKSKKFIKSKALKKKIFKGKVYMLDMTVSGKRIAKLNNVGIASVGKVKTKTKFKMMKLLGKKAKKAKGRKAKKAFSLLKKGGLYKASFDKKTKTVYFNTKGDLKKMYFGLVKIAPKKKAKKAKRAR